LAHQGRRQADRQPLGQDHLVELECGQRGLAGEPADQHGQLMARLFQVPFQRRQGRPSLRHLRLLRQEIGTGCASEPKTEADQFKLLFLGRKNFTGRPDLRPQGCLLHRRRDHVGGERDMGALQLKPPVFDLGFESLQTASRAAEEIEGIGDVHRRVEETEGAPVGVRLSERSPRDLLA